MIDRRPQSKWTPWVISVILGIPIFELKAANNQGLQLVGVVPPYTRVETKIKPYGRTVEFYGRGNENVPIQIDVTQGAGAADRRPANDSHKYSTTRYVVTPEAQKTDEGLKVPLHSDTKVIVSVP
jgi:hypothetical protein